MLKGFAELRESGTVRISFGKAGYALVDPKKSLGGDPVNGIPVRYRMRGKGLGERMLQSIKAQYPLCGVSQHPRKAEI